MVEASGPAAPWITRLAVQGVTAKVMAAQDFLLDSQVQAWLDGLEPAWTLLTFESLQALRHEPAATRTAIRIANDLSCDEIARSPIARNTLILLRAAIAHGGLPLTATGNLTRAVVTKMCTLVAWPNYDQADAFRFNKVINEPDFQPLHVVRQLVQAASLVRAQHGKLVATPLGDLLLSEAQQASLLAILFHLQPRGGQVAPVAGDRRCGRRQLAGAGPRCGGTFRGFRKGRWTADNALGRHSVDFSDQKGDRISSDQIVTELCQFEGHPWPDYRRGNPINKHQVARLLEPLGIRPEPEPIRFENGDRKRGYLLSAFGDAFARYLPP